jgi:hypothetical protein
MRFGIRDGFPQRNLGGILGAVAFFPIGLGLALAGGGLSVGALLAAGIMVWCSIGIAKDLREVTDESQRSTFGKLAGLSLLGAVVLVVLGALGLAGIKLSSR